MSNREKATPIAVSSSERGDRKLAVQYWPLDKILPYKRNPRTHPQSQIDQIIKSIETFGFINPVLIDSFGGILAGHGRHIAATQIKLAELPVIVIDDLSEAEKRALVIADNNISLGSKWDKTLLSQELTALKGSDFDLDVLAFDDATLHSFIDSTAENEKLDAVVEPPAIPKSRLGDVYQLGAHRIVCGDCTDPKVVAACLDGAKPRLMVTDPPYGVSLDGEWRDKAGINKKAPAEKSYMKKRTAGHDNTTISNDTVVDWSHAFELVPSIDVAYVWHASYYTREVLNGLERLGFLYRQQLIWDKGMVVMMRTHYWYQHEPCWYVRRKNAPWYGKPGAASTTIWQAKSPKMIMAGSDEEKWDHPTQKPIELMKRSIINHTRKGELVYEPFLGSGTTLAAAEVTGRVCHGIELDPRFVDVVIARWESISGLKAKRLHREKEKK